MDFLGQKEYRCYNFKTYARLVARGLLQRYNIDYNKVFSIAVRFETLRLVVAITSNNYWSLYQLDVKFSFLNVPLEEIIYVTYPLGF